MKKLIVLSGLLFSALAFGQVSLTGNGQEITEGQIFTTNSLTAPGNKVTLIATNNSDADVHLKLRADEVSYPTEENVQFCFGQLCYYNLFAGNMVPNGPTGLTLEPGASNTNLDHFESANPGNGTDPVNYKFSLIQLDDDGQIIATLRTFYFTYTPLSAINNFEALKNMGVTVNRTIVKNQLDITATTTATLNLFTTTGQLVKTISIKEGDQGVDVSSLASGLYVASFTTQENKTGSIKIVKD